MERGEIRQELRTTQPEQPSGDFLDEVVRKLADELGLDVGDLPLKSVFVSTQQLPSRHGRNSESDDRLTVLWHNERPAAMLLETRDNLNMVLTQSVYFGAQTYES